jgi:hypothetical protein
MYEITQYVKWNQPDNYSYSGQVIVLLFIVPGAFTVLVSVIVVFTFIKYLIDTKVIINKVKFEKYSVFPDALK